MGVGGKLNIIDFFKIDIVPGISKMTALYNKPNRRTTINNQKQLLRIDQLWAVYDSSNILYIEGLKPNNTIPVRITRHNQGVCATMVRNNKKKNKGKKGKRNEQQPNLPAAVVPAAPAAAAAATAELVPGTAAFMAAAKATAAATAKAEENTTRAKTNAERALITGVGIAAAKTALTAAKKKELTAGVANEAALTAAFANKEIEFLITKNDELVSRLKVEDLKLQEIMISAKTASSEEVDTGTAFTVATATGAAAAAAAQAKENAVRAKFNAAGATSTGVGMAAAKTALIAAGTALAEVVAGYALLWYDLNKQPDERSKTFSMCGREVPTDVYTTVRNRAFGGIIKEFGFGIPDDIPRGVSTQELADFIRERFVDAALLGCISEAMDFYSNQPDYSAPKFNDMNKKCGQEFAEKVAREISGEHAVNIVAIEDEQQQQGTGGTVNQQGVSKSRIDGNDDDDDDAAGGVATTASSFTPVGPASNMVAAASVNNEDADVSEREPAGKIVCTTDDRWVTDDSEDEKKPAAQQDYTTDREIVKPSLLSPLESLEKDEKELREIFASQDYITFDEAKIDCISDDLLITLIAKESDGSCSHGNSGRYHISRALEVLTILSKGNDYDGPDALKIAVARQAGFTDEKASKPELAQFFFSTVTNLIRIDPGLEGENCYDFSKNFLRTAIEVKDLLQPDTATHTNNEERQGGFRHLYNHKLLKHKRDVVTERGMINMCYRETKIFCQCMKPLRVAGKTQEKVGYCFGCNEEFPKTHLSYCSGCLYNVYCSFDCSKQDWVQGNHKHHCARKNYTRCSKCRVMFPFDESSVHKCMIDHDGDNDDDADAADGIATTASWSPSTVAATTTPVDAKVDTAPATATSTTAATLKNTSSSSGGAGTAAATTKETDERSTNNGFA